jgi:hypothetical protein
MLPPRQQRPAKRRRLGWLGRDGWRSVVACLSIACLIATSFYMGDWWSHISPKPLPPAKPDEALAFATGSVLIVPLSGDSCRQLLIDNATWRIRDHGMADCNEALINPVGAKQMSTIRSDVMRMVFGRR